MVGLQKFIRQQKRDDDNPKITDEQIIELWLKTATRGSIYYYESRLENPDISDSYISINYKKKLEKIKRNVYYDFNHNNEHNIITQDYKSKDYDCGCKPGQKCPTYYRHKYYIEQYSQELKYDHSYRFDYNPYIEVECLAKVRSEKYCKNRSKYKNRVSDMSDTKPAREIPIIRNT